MSAIEHRGANRIRDVWRDEQPIHPSLRGVSYQRYMRSRMTELPICWNLAATRGRVRNIRHPRFCDGSLSFIIISVVPVLSCNFPGLMSSNR